MSKYGVVQGYSPIVRRRFFRWLGAAIAAAWFSLATALPLAYAHAEQVQTTPTEGQRLDVSPAVVELTFDERLDSGSARLSVLNGASRTVASGQPAFFGQGKGIRLALPKLPEGRYTVSYSVISADGHPVSGAFIFTVGSPPPAPDAGRLDPHAQVGHRHGGSAAGEDRNLPLYAVRMAYYAGLLVTAGLAFWSLMRGSPVVSEARDRAISLAGKFTLLATLACVALSLMDLNGDEPLSAWFRILRDTTIGRLYAGELLLALAAPLLPGLGRAGRVVWAAVFLAIEAWSGHAAAFEPKAYTIGLDFAHLAAASVWAGGLALVLLVWHKERPEAGRFALIFSRWALIAFLALWVTGVLSVLAFLPSLQYLTLTAWGTWLLVKTGIAALVAVTAFLIRWKLRRGELPHGAAIKADAGWLAAIVFVVGILTYQTPLPPNEPLHYHLMGTDMHVTLRIAPNAPGDNSFILKVWLPDKDPAPKEVRLRLLPQGRANVGSIEVPLKAYGDQEIDAFPGFAKYAFQADGPYLPFAAEWKAQILVTDGNGEQKARETTFRIY